MNDSLSMFFINGWEHIVDINAYDHLLFVMTFLVARAESLLPALLHACLRVQKRQQHVLHTVGPLIHISSYRFGHHLVHHTNLGT